MPAATCKAALPYPLISNTFFHFLISTLPALLGQLQVATKEDPASARPGESLYAFIPRRCAGQP